MGLWGYSGGGLASAWAAELCERYAPELNIVGAALGSPVGDPGSVARRLNGSVFAGLVALMISALTQSSPARRTSSTSTRLMRARRCSTSCRQ